MTSEETILELLSNLKKTILDIKRDASEIRSHVENCMGYQLQAPGEGQAAMPESIYEDLLEDVNVLHAAFQRLFQEVGELNPAQ